MKRVLAMLLLLSMVLSLAACGKKKTQSQESSIVTTVPTDTPTISDTHPISEPAEIPTDNPTIASSTEKAPEKATTAPTTKATAAPTTKATAAPTTKATAAPTTKATTAPSVKATEKPISPTPTTKPTEAVHTHTWKNATCQAPKTCTDCGATEGSVAEHIFANDVCTVCNASNILNPITHLKISGNTTEEYISKVYTPYDEETISARGFSFYNDGGYGEGVYCLLLDAMFSSNEEEVNTSRTPVIYEGKKYYRIGAGMSPSVITLTDTYIKIGSIKLVLLSDGTLKVTESSNPNYPKNMLFSTDWSYLK